MPRISVIIPTYNRAAFLKEAIQSVLDQTFNDFELWIVDDGSTDQTKTIVASFDDQRVYSIYQTNQGVSAARNAGLKKSKGELISFLDSDDHWKPEKLGLQVQYHQEHPDILVSQTEEIWIRNGVRVNPMKKHTKPSGWIFDECLTMCAVSPSSVMIHHSVFENCGFFDESLPACEDYDLWLRIALKYEIALLPQALIVKNGGHADQLSQAHWGMDRFRIRALLKILDDPSLSDDQRKKVEEEIENKCRILNTGALKRGSQTYEATRWAQTQ